MRNDQLDEAAAPLWALPREEARDRLVEHYTKFAVRLARTAARKNPIDDPGELLQSAMIALWYCIEAYDPTEGVKFTTYAHRRITMSSIDAKRMNDWVQPKVRLAEKEGRIELPAMLPLKELFDGEVREDGEPQGMDLAAMLQRIPDNARWYVGAYLDGGDEDAAAALLGVTPEHFGGLLKWAVEELRKVPVHL